MGRHTILLLATLLVFLGGCSSSGPRTINLMPAPAVFAGGAIDTFPDQPPLTHSDFGLLYATDRQSEYPLKLRSIDEVGLLGSSYNLLTKTPDLVLVASELWHFMGYRGAFIAYAWPSTPRVLAYMSDLELVAAHFPPRTTAGNADGL
jgi:hypothetical protein